MNHVATRPGVGGLIRDWRQRRRLSQLDLALEADVSTRHLSFVETGRARPSRDFVLHIAEHLEVPLRERNELLLAAGFAPAFPQTPIDAAEMAPVRAALKKILAGHTPFPAVVIDKHWNLVLTNDSALAVFGDDVSPDLMAQPANALRLTLHPEGLAGRIENFGEYSSHLLTRLRRQAAASQDPVLIALVDELRSYPGTVDDPSAHTGPADMLFIPLVIRANGRRLSFFSTIATFGTALDITLAELSIESFFPADEETAMTLRAL